MPGNWHVRFLGEPGTAMCPAYLTVRRTDCRFACLSMRRADWCGRRPPEMIPALAKAGDRRAMGLRFYSHRLRTAMTAERTTQRSTAEPSGRGRGLPKSLPKLTSSQSTEQNSEHLSELKALANNSDDLKSARCKAVNTGSIPVVASVPPANRGLLCGQPVVSPARLPKCSPNGAEIRPNQATSTPHGATGARRRRASHPRS